MVSSEVQRTIVKSPPELWAELSDPAALARHLGELGEIRITRVEPEQKVEWEAEETSGTVLIDPSGWGTRVTLKVTREIPAQESPHAPEAPSQPEVTAPRDLEATVPARPEATVAARPEPFASAEDEAEPEVAIDPEPALDAGAEQRSPTQAEPRLQPEPEPALEDVFMAELEPRRGFFARMFRRHRAIGRPSFESANASPLERSPEPADAFAAVRRALAPETFAAAHPFATTHLAAPPPPQPQPAQIEEAAELDEPQAQTAEEPQQTDGISDGTTAADDVATDEVTAVLTSVLDRLGAAHHRPFSRA
jgi:hypothetical protein